ncbi:hypothetical protein WJX84_012166 [Apatococcus fuscideae]|uniref:Proteasome subunit alpha type n=1 Tax=Apatococcus fuscideae TaxID=2026836 RepID=A0AAW1T039_9CHLO
MFRNQYDTDVVTWSPQGRIHQVEYAMEAVKQGSTAVALKSNTHVVLATLNRADSELTSSLQKIFKVDDHLGIAASGLISDGRSLCKFMRSECLNHRYVYESAMPVTRLVREVADNAQVCTQRSWKRPYGVGLLVAGHDKSGPRLFYCCPSGNYYEYLAHAIGGRSQAARTYLERKHEEYPDASLDGLIGHALQALDQDFKELDEASLQPYIQALRDAEGGDGGGGADGAAPMES